MYFEAKGSHIVKRLPEEPRCVIETPSSRGAQPDVPPTGNVKEQLQKAFSSVVKKGFSV